MTKNFLEEIKKTILENKLFLIAYYGPSTTSQEYMFPNWGEIIRYVLKYQLYDELNKNWNSLWDIHTINLGLDGATSSDLLERFDNLVLKRNPNLLLLDASKNDVFLKVNKNLTEKNFRELISRALENNIKVVFTSRIPALTEELNKKINEYDEIDKKVAKEFEDNKNFIWIDLFKLYPKNLIKKTYTLIHPEDNKPIGIKAGDIDPIHYNKFGNVIVAKILLEKSFGIDFDENKFLADLDEKGKMFPDY
jgi:lysophospholipase L1-like esterase